MTECPHCHTDHKPDMRDWPCTWDADRREGFVRKMIPLGVLPLYIPTMAAEVEKLSATFQGVEDELVTYLTASGQIARKVSRIEEKRARWLSWSKTLSKPFLFTTADGFRLITAKLFFLALLGLPFLIITGPIRIPFAIARWWVARKLEPYFIGWLRKRQPGK